MVGHGERPKELAALLTELVDQATDGCGESVLETLETAMGRKNFQWIQGQIPTFEAALQPLFTSLPNNQGRLDEHMARYALHRIFVDERGWFVKSLSEEDPYKPDNSSTLPSLTSVLQDEVPPSVRMKFDTCLQHGSVRLKDLAVLAATLENLVHQEVLERAKAVFSLNKLPLFGHIDLDQMSRVLEQVMMSYILEGAGIPDLLEEYASGNRSIAELYPNWPGLQRFLLSIEGVLLPAQATHMSFDDLADIIHELQTHFGHWQDGECQEQQRELQEIEDCPGRVRLRDFYAGNVHGSNWQFSESPVYLRMLGILDESQQDVPRVIVPNYVQGPNNCLASSKYYTQCCLNKCSRHLSSLERAIGASETSPELLWAAVAAVLPNPEPPASMLWERLRNIAVSGKVALHGPLFAEWLHRAYPRDCPAPPKPRGPTQEEPLEYLARTGQGSDISKEDMEAFLKETPDVFGTCDVLWLPTSPDVVRDASVTARILLASPSDGFTGFAGATIGAVAAVLGLGVVTMIVQRSVSQASTRRASFLDACAES